MAIILTIGQWNNAYWYAEAVVEHRIDELAQVAGTTVRNVRAYQDRGLLPPPRRVGRVALYGDAHVARLRLIGRLLERGYNIANIHELLGAWERGRDLRDVIGLEEAVTGPWSDEVPGWVTPDALVEMFPDGDDASIARAVELGYLVPDDGRFCVPSPRQLHAGAELAAAGVPLDAVLDLGAELRADVDRIAERFVGMVARHVLPAAMEGGVDQLDIPALAAVVRRLRPLAEAAVRAELARAMQHHTLETLGDQLAALLELLPEPAEEAS